MTQVAPNPAPTPPPVEITPPETQARIDASKPKTAVVKLDRHYRPGGEVEIVGHWTPRKEVKNARTGKMEVLEEEAFHMGEPMPPPLAGVGTASGKLWAGTVARFPVDEAKRIRQNAIGTIEVDDY